MSTESRIDAFMDAWQGDSTRMKECFRHFSDLLRSMEMTSSEFVEREGLTYSLRYVHEKQQKKPLFAMIDVIEGDPRWLSICFYAEFITDPEERGDFVPGGLLGENATCFDLESYDEDVIAYISSRLQEAYQHAGGNS